MGTLGSASESRVRLPSLHHLVRPARRALRQRMSRAALARREPQPTLVNLCAGTQRVPGWLAVDVDGDVDLLLDLSRSDLPFADGSLEAVACMSAINYFARPRALRIVAETHRVLRPGGVARFGVQDLRRLAARYVARDLAFFGQKRPDGTDRFEGETLGDKFASWFYGYPTAGGPCRYVYDYESLALLFHAAGFSVVEERPFQSSRLADAGLLDNRPDQMFFLEAVK